MNVQKLRSRVDQSRDTLITLFTGALSLMFTQAFVTYLNGKMNEFNIWGVDPQVFELFAIGAVLLALIWFGIIKHPTRASL